MIEWIVSASVLILMVIVLRHFLKGKISLRLQYALWGLVLVRLLLPFSFGSSEWSVLNVLPEGKLYWTPEVYQATDAVQNGQNTVGLTDNRVILGGISGQSGLENEQAANQEKTETESLQKTGDKLWNSAAFSVLLAGWIEILKVVWVLGMVLVGSVLLTANGMFAARLKKSRRGYEVAGAVLPVYLTEAVDTPCLFGLFCPAIYLTPSAVEQEKSQYHILEHETTHYRHKDHIWAFLRGVCLAAHWYNPLVWWAAALSRTDAELACDEATIRRIGEQERADYGRTLIGMTCERRSGLLVTATTMTGSKSGIKERIMLLAKKPKMAAYTLVAVLVLVVVAAGCTFTGKKEPVNAENGGILAATPTPSLTTSPALTETPEFTVMPVATPTATALPENPTPTVVAPLEEPMPTDVIAELTQAPEENATVFDITAELSEVETAYAEKQQKLQNDTSLTQADMNVLAGECVTLWEEAMDTFWKELEPLLTAKEVLDLNTEQQEWLDKRDAQIQAIIAEYDGGSITGLLVGQKKAELTRERVYELAGYLTEVANQVLNAPVQDYSGKYVDNQGIDEEYNELFLTRQTDGSYQVKMVIYRLALFEGTAVQQGALLFFEDPDMRVKGNIRILDGAAIFTVTESYFEYVTPGEGFEFYRK